MVVFVSLKKDKEEAEEGENEETKPIFEVTYLGESGTLEGILLKFGVWYTEVGGRVHRKNCLVSLRQHRATEVQKSSFLSSCQYTNGCCAPASWAARHTTVCLDFL